VLDEVSTAIHGGGAAVNGCFSAGARFLRSTAKALLE